MARDVAGPIAEEDWDDAFPSAALSPWISDALAQDTLGIGGGGGGYGDKFGDRRNRRGRPRGGRGTEETLAHALEWLAEHQNPSGSWSPEDFASNCGQCYGSSGKSD